MINRVKNATKKGFSLVELLVVVAIIGVLAGVGIVAYNNYIEDAETKVVEANAKLLAKNIAAERAKDRTKLGSAIASDAVTSIKAGGAKGTINVPGTVTGTAEALAVADCGTIASGAISTFFRAKGTYTESIIVCYNDGTTKFIKAY